MSRYVVGIDLGTTNCAAAYVDLESEELVIEPLEIDQVTAPGEVDTCGNLPSFALLPSEHEVAPAAMALPWAAKRDYAVGVMARDRGSELPHRLVSSAKSWLSYAGVDRTAAILPWRGSDEPEPDERRISPLEASARYLQHIREAWDHETEEPLAEQDILITVPASFDAVARELTVKAAREAGLEKVTLLEEPQAAFYSWLAVAGDDWRRQLETGDVALVCDIGGGTSDFSLIEVTDDGSGNLELERVAVGEHILLGGDNMDLTLAQIVIQRLGDKGKKLSASQYRSLVHSCRRAKEEILGPKLADKVRVSILGSGSKLIGGTLKSEVLAEDVETLLAGFFPEVDKDEPLAGRRSLGLKELGLPYATDPAITRHLAAFLRRHDREPTKLLFNGGVMQSSQLREAISDRLEAWTGRDVATLTGTNLDLAVAHGAAYYGLVRRGKGIRIRGGTARSYYIGVESAMPAIPGFAPPIKALCVAPFGMEEGTTTEVPGEELGLVIGESTRFRFFASTSRQSDVPGAVIDPDEDELRELPSIEANLDTSGGRSAGDIVPVSMSASYTEVGTLELWGEAKKGDGRWRLEYSLRQVGGEE